MAWTFVAAASATAAGAGTSLACTAALNVAASDALVCFVSLEGADSGTVSCGDGASNILTMESVTAEGSQVAGFGYLLSASANATATFTFGNTTSCAYRSVVVFQFRPTSGATVTLDAHPTPHANGTGTAESSGTITTTGTDVVVVGGHKCFNNATAADMQIGGVAADFHEHAGGAADALSTAWGRILSATATDIAATITSANDKWICGVVALKASTTSQSPVVTILRQYAQQIGA